MTTEQANGSANGWIFQVSAGIVLTLRNIKDFDKIKIEGKTEDIELIFTSGKGLFAQAKSVLDINDTNNNIAYLKKALHSLEKIDDNNFKLMYITNIRNPLSGGTKNNFNYDGEYSFQKDLSIQDQDFIRKIVGKGFRFDDFSIYRLYFFGDGENVYKSIKEEIKEFLISIGVDSAYSNRLLQYWNFQYITNCRDKYLHISKKELIFPLILELIDKDISDSNQEKMNISDEYDRISKRYRDIISEKRFRFEFVVKILTDYQKNNEGLSKEAYINENWEKYLEDFDSLIDIDVEPLIKTILWKIINERKIISNVKKEVRL